MTGPAGFTSNVRIAATTVAAAKRTATSDPRTRRPTESGRDGSSWGTCSSIGAIVGVEPRTRKEATLLESARLGPLRPRDRPDAPGRAEAGREAALGAVHRRRVAGRRARGGQDVER